MSVLAAFARSPYLDTVFTRKNGVFILTATASACEIRWQDLGVRNKTVVAYIIRRLQGYVEHNTKERQRPLLVPYSF